MFRQLTNYVSKSESHFAAVFADPATLFSRHPMEVVAYIEKKEHLAALGTFQGLEEQCTFLGTVLEVAARLPRK